MFFVFQDSYVLSLWTFDVRFTHSHIIAMVHDVVTEKKGPFFLELIIYVLLNDIPLAQSAGAVEYNDCTSAEGLEPSPNECPGYDTKQSDSEVPVMLGFWGIRSTPSLPLLPGSHWPGVVAPDRALSIG